METKNPNTIYGYDLETGVLGIDGSAVRNYLACPRRFLLSFHNRRVLAATKPALDFGSALHEMEHDRIKGCLNLDRIIEKYHLDTVDDHRNADMLRRFNKKVEEQFPNDFPTLMADGVPVVEGSFAVPLNERVIWLGRIDRGIVLRDGSPAILDHKTSSRDEASFWNQFEFDLSQFGYLWAAGQAYGKLIDRFVIRAYFTRKSDSPKAKGIEIKEMDFVVDHRRLEQWKTFISSVTARIIEDLENVMDLGESESYSNECNANWASCYAHKYGPCPYVSICRQPDLYGRQTLLEGAQFKRNDWNPLEEVGE